MLDLQSEVQPKTIHRLEVMAGFYSNKETFVQDMLDYKITDLRRGSFNMRLDLQEYEDQHNMTTETFYAQFMDGKIDDSEEYMLWAGVYEMWLECEAQLQELV